MTSKIVTEYGKTKEEAELRLKTKFPNTRQEIIFERTFIKGWKFWDKNWELKALIHEEVPKKVEESPKNSGNTKNNSNTNNSIKKKTTPEVKEMKETDERKAALLKMLSNPESSQSKETLVTTGDKNIDQLMQTIDVLVKKLDTDKNDKKKKTVPLPLKKMESYLKEQEIDSQTARSYVETLAEKFQNVPVIEEKEVNEGVRALIENQINVMGPMNTKDRKIIALVGPTGVGKTTTLAKIGWELISNNRTVGFITTDTFRSGAVEQLKSYAKNMDAETKVAKSAHELKEAIHYFQNANRVDHILIDTVGRNPLANNSIETVKEYLDIAKPENEKEMLTCLVLSSTSKVRDLKETVGRFSEVSIDAMVFTKLDETYNVGSILNVFNFTKLPLLYVTDGQDITKNIYAPTKRMLSEKILNKEKTLEGRILA